MTKPLMSDLVKRMKPEDQLKVTTLSCKIIEIVEGLQPEECLPALLLATEFLEDMFKKNTGIDLRKTRDK